jgi:DNA (cytosine-5)-methyltransferase 1
VATQHVKPARQGRAGRWSADPNALPNVRGEPLRLEPRLEHATEADVARWLRRLRRPWAVDVFCGAGGLGLGLHQAGFSVVAAADNDPAAIETYAANLESLTYCDDLSDPSSFLEFLSGNGIESVDLVAGGPPCQPFSRAGASKIRSLVAQGIRDRHDPRADLWLSFSEIVRALKPKIVLLENVPDMGRWNDGAVLVGVMQSLRELGYVPDTRILDAFRYGVPQHRARIFVIGVARGRFEWPAEKEREVTLRAAIGDLPVVGGAQQDRELPYRGPRTAFQRAAREGVSKDHRKLIFDHCTRGVRPDDLKAYRLMKPGQTYADLPEHLRRYRADIFDDKYKRLAWNELSRTITAHIARDGYWYIHPEQHRTLSIREAARIQTFPDWFRFAGHPTTQFRQIGNAVPPALAREIGKSIAQALRRRTHPEDTRFRDELVRWHRDGNRLPLPWRSSFDPWLILISELLVRRTPPERMGDAYERLRAIAPDPGTTESRARSVRSNLRQAGMGRQADLVIDIARVVMREHGGAVPAGDVEIRMLPGVGDYLASVVRCLAFGVRTVVISESSRRIVGRFTGRSAESNWTARLELFRLAGPRGPDAEFNLALADLAATVCTTSEPNCTVCPLARDCALRTRPRRLRVAA